MKAIRIDRLITDRIVNALLSVLCGDVDNVATAAGLARSVTGVQDRVNIRGEFPIVRR